MAAAGAALLHGAHPLPAITPDAGPLEPHDGIVLPPPARSVDELVQHAAQLDLMEEQLFKERELIMRDEQAIQTDWDALVRSMEVSAVADTSVPGVEGAAGQGPRSFGEAAAALEASRQPDMTLELQQQQLALVSAEDELRERYAHWQTRAQHARALRDQLEEHLQQTGLVGFVGRTGAGNGRFSGHEASPLPPLVAEAHADAAPAPRAVPPPPAHNSLQPAAAAGGAGGAGRAPPAASAAVGAAAPQLGRWSSPLPPPGVAPVPAPARAGLPFAPRATPAAPPAATAAPPPPSQQQQQQQQQQPQPQPPLGASHLPNPQYGGTELPALRGPNPVVTGPLGAPRRPGQPPAPALSPMLTPPRNAAGGASRQVAHSDPGPRQPPPPKAAARVASHGSSAGGEAPGSFADAHGHGSLSASMGGGSFAGRPLGGSQAKSSLERRAHIAKALRAGRQRGASEPVDMFGFEIQNALGGGRSRSQGPQPLGAAGAPAGPWAAPWEAADPLLSGGGGGGAAAAAAAPFGAAGALLHQRQTSKKAMDAVFLPKVRKTCSLRSASDADDEATQAQRDEEDQQDLAASLEREATSRRARARWRALFLVAAAKVRAERLVVARQEREAIAAAEEVMQAARSVRRTPELPSTWSLPKTVQGFKQLHSGQWGISHAKLEHLSINSALLEADAAVQVKEGTRLHVFQALGVVVGAVGGHRRGSQEYGPAGARKHRRSSDASLSGGTGPPIVRHDEDEMIPWQGSAPGSRRVSPNPHSRRGSYRRELQPLHAPVRRGSSRRGSSSHEPRAAAARSPMAAQRRALPLPRAQPVRRSSQDVHGQLLLGGEQLHGHSLHGSPVRPARPSGALPPRSPARRAPNHFGARAARRSSGAGAGAGLASAGVDEGHLVELGGVPATFTLEQRLNLANVPVGGNGTRSARPSGGRRSIGSESSQGGGGQRSLRDTPLMGGVRGARLSSEHEASPPLGGRRSLRDTPLMGGVRGARVSHEQEASPQLGGRRSLKDTPGAMRRSLRRLLDTGNTLSAAASIPGGAHQLQPTFGG